MLFNAKAIPAGEQQWYYITHIREDKEVYSFPKNTSECNSEIRA